MIQLSVGFIYGCGIMLKLSCAALADICWSDFVSSTKNDDVEQMLDVY